MSADDDLLVIRRGDLAYAMRKADPLHPLGVDECAARDRLLAVVAGSTASCRSCALCERELSAVRLELQAVVRERDQYRDALERVAVICEDAASDACDCEAYYKCGTCPARIANRADDAVEVARAALQ